ncbi:hypothetical protein SLA2020_389410 [Shorea laevis]
MEEVRVILLQLKLEGATLICTSPTNASHRDTVVEGNQFSSANILNLGEVFGEGLLHLYRTERRLVSAPSAKQQQHSSETYEWLGEREESRGNLGKCSLRLVGSLRGGRRWGTLRTVERRGVREEKKRKWRRDLVVTVPVLTTRKRAWRKKPANKWGLKKAVV